MLSRHFLRTKVLQAVYASQALGNDLVVTEKNLKHDIMRLNDLGTMQLAALVHFRDIAEQMTEEARSKYLATAADLNPNRKLLENRFLNRLAENFDLRSHCEAAKVNWSAMEMEFRGMYADFVKLQEYGKYLKEEDSFDNDKAMVLVLFKYLMNEERLREGLYKGSLLWEEDFDQIAQYNYNMLKSLDETLDVATEIPLMSDSRNGMDVEAMEFARRLLMVTLRNGNEVERLIRMHLQGWEYDRVASMDVLLLNMAVAELTECPSIPERVTVDEYIELSKEFSTSRSKLFINGILDKIILELHKENRIHKNGRGLYVPEGETDSSDRGEEVQL